MKKKKIKMTILLSLLSVSTYSMSDIDIIRPEIEDPSLNRVINYNGSRGNAFDQGVISNTQLAEQAEQEKDAEYKNTTRMIGDVQIVPVSDHGILLPNNEMRDPTMKYFYINWAGRLIDKGVSLNKIEFEAMRLNKEDFEKWASNMYRSNR